MNADKIKARQAACQVVYDKMLERMLHYSPCEKMTVGDLLYFTRCAQNLAFDATGEVLL
jgi:hypothetical protein